MDIARAIRVRMAEMNMDVATAAQRGGWNYQYVVLCRTGKNNALIRIQKWAEVLELSPSELVRRAEEYGQKAA